MLSIDVLVVEVTHSDTHDVITLSSLAGDWIHSLFQRPTTHHTFSHLRNPTEFSHLLVPHLYRTFYSHNVAAFGVECHRLWEGYIIVSL
jgi:hypothetical protein